MNNDDILRPDETSEDKIGSVLRPKTFGEYTGQEKDIDNLKIYVKAAKDRGESLDHCLFYGPPGLGKTTLAYIIARELGVNIRATIGPTIKRSGDLAALLTNLSSREVLFIDEIHRLHSSVEEILYPAMEDFKLDLVIGQGPAARSMRLDLPKFTLIGATTRMGLLTSPLIDRFKIIIRLKFYSIDELADIILRGARLLGTVIDSDAALEIAKRSRGTPRIANRILSRMRDFADILNNGIISLNVAQDGFNRLEIDKEGLDVLGRRLLEAIIFTYEGGPVGLETLAAAISEEKDTIEDFIEPFLIYNGFLKKTARGRVATKTAYKHMGVKYTNGKSIEDFLE